jgi:hypothetical protein
LRRRRAGSASDAGEASGGDAGGASGGGAGRWSGIHYLSEFGYDLDNRAIFEPDAPTPDRRLTSSTTETTTHRLRQGGLDRGLFGAR